MLGLIKWWLWWRRYISEYSGRLCSSTGILWLLILKSLKYIFKYKLYEWCFHPIKVLINLSAFSAIIISIKILKVRKYSLSPLKHEWFHPYFDNNGAGISNGWVLIISNSKWREDFMNIPFLVCFLWLFALYFTSRCAFSKKAMQIFMSKPIISVVNVSGVIMWPKCSRECKLNKTKNN